MTDHIVVGDRVAVTVRFRAAQARLRILALGGMLLRASEVAYGEGVTGLVELAGPAAGLTRLADVCLEDLAETDDCAQIAVQWEAIAADGKLFTALDADLMLVPAGDQATAMSLTGAYRPQPGRAGAGLDQVIVGCCATAAIGSFLDQLACALVHPAGTAGHAGRRTLRLPPMASQNRWLDGHRTDSAVTTLMALAALGLSGDPTRSTNRSTPQGSASCVVCDVARLLERFDSFAALPFLQEVRPRVPNATFAVLALESEPVDRRLYLVLGRVASVSWGILRSTTSRATSVSRRL